jgi:Flp pilus assembly protein TadD
VEADARKLSIDNPVGRAEAETELMGLFEDPEFHCSERNKRFLQFISEKLFEGEEAAIKAYTIAVDVFGRPPNFDPAIDPIVRIEATRLRSSLERYYEGHGHRKTLRISLPAGRYVPEFTRRPVQNGSYETEMPAASSGRSVRKSNPMPTRLHPGARTRFIAVALGCVGGLALGVFFLLVSRLNGVQSEAFSAQPTVSIELQKAENQPDISGAQLRDALIVALERFQTLRILSPTLNERGEQGRPSDSDSQAKYRLTLKYGRDPFGSRLWWQVIGVGDGEILMSGVENVSAEDQNWADPGNALIANLATRVAGGTGIINNAEASAMNDAALGNGCIVHAYLAVELADQHALDASRSCLQRTIELSPRDARAKAALAVVLLEPDPSMAPETLRKRALDFADQSAMAEPDSSASAYAQMLARHSNGNLAGAVVSGRRALSINPYDMRTAAGLGGILILAGRRDEAVPLLAEASRGRGRAAAEATAMLAFDSYQRGVYDEALRRLQQSAVKDGYVFQLLEIATLGQAGRKAEASQVIEMMRKARPGFETGFFGAMASYSIAPSVAGALQDGLKMAGLKPR